MKKFALLLAISAFTTAAQADISTGFYAGVAAGHSSPAGHATNDSVRAVYDAADTANDFQNLDGENLKFDHGQNFFNPSVYVGYGWVTGCTYLGAELGYTYANEELNMKSTVTEDEAAGLAYIFKGKFQRDHVFSAAVRAGYKFSPSTMAYVRLGVNYSEAKLSFTYFDKAGSSTVEKKSNTKNHFNFVPGVGIETEMTKNVWLRAEFTYEIGTETHKVVRSVENGVGIDTASADGTVAMNRYTGRLKDINTASFKLGIAYKF